MKKPSKFTIERAKRTMLGRIACRLLGDQTGAVLMEYVVLGVLVVAACVAMIIVFGKEIRESFHKMIEAIKGHPVQVEQIENNSTLSQEATAAQTQGDNIAGGGN